MKIAPEALAFLGTPPAQRHQARRVQGYAGTQHEQPNQHTKEKTMPRGVYERKKRVSIPVEEVKEVTRGAIADARIVKNASLRKPKHAARRAIEDRKDQAEVAPPQAGEPAMKTRRKVQRKAAISAANRSGARFGVFDDGSVEVRLPACAGTLAPDEATAFLDFIKRLQG